MDPLSFQNLGGLESPRDYRDHKDPEISMGLSYPPASDTTLFDVYNQHKIGQCTDNLAELVSYLYFLKTGEYVKLSRRFLHAITKDIIDQNTTEGSSLRATLKAAYNYGICTEATYPSDITDSTTYAQFIDINAIPAKAWIEGLKYKIGGYIAIPTDIDSLKIALYKYHLLYSRMEIGKEWWTGEDGVSSWDEAKILPLRYPDMFVSGHAVLHKGYNVNNLVLRNSWSEAWAHQGEGWHRFSYNPTETWGVTLDRIVNDLPPTDQFHHTFKTPMEKGQRSEEVKNLQIALMILGDLDYVQPVDRGFYGELTQAAVYRFQIRLLPLSWIERYVYRGRYAGPKTLARLTAIFG